MIVEVLSKIIVLLYYKCSLCTCSLINLNNFTPSFALYFYIILEIERGEGYESNVCRCPYDSFFEYLKQHIFTCNNMGKLNK